MRVVASRTTTLALVALAILVAAPVASGAQDLESARLLLGRADTLLREGDSAGALPVLDRLLARFGDSTPVGDAERLILQRALLARATARLAEGDRDGVDDDFDRLIDMDATYDLAAGADETLRGRFDRRRERKVGYLTIGRFPVDLEVVLDGEPLRTVPDILPVLAGDHVVTGRMPGFAPVTHEVSVRANRTEGVGLELERISATIRIRTQPPGATVSLNGAPMGTTQPASSAPSLSEVLVIDGLLPGRHNIEVQLPDHEPFRQSIDVPDLRDYDLGTLRMDLARGNLVLQGLPSDARVEVDDREVEPERRDGVAGGRLTLAVGAHQILVSAPGGHVWEGSASVDNGRTTTIDATPRPGIAFLGVFGGDQLDRTEAETAIAETLRAHTGWWFMDRRATGAAHLSSDFDRLAADEGLDTRRRLEDLEPGALFLVGRFTADNQVEWLLWAADSPLAPARTTLAAGDRGALNAWTGRILETPLAPPRPWFGARIVDDGYGPGPVISAIDSGSPAARADLRVGDRLTGIGSTSVDRALGAQQILARQPTFTGINLAIVRSGVAMGTTVALEPGPQVLWVVDRGRASVVWAAAEALRARPAGEMPPWVLRLQQGLLLLAADQPAAAVRVLTDVVAPGDRPFGQAAVDYWTGVAWAERDGAGSTGALQSFENALKRVGGRLFHSDGPLVSPRARARLDALDVR